MSKKNPVVQVVLGEEKGGAGMVGEVVIESEHVPGVRFTPTGFELTDPNLPLEEWLRIGRMIGHMNRSLNWWVGDWINKGEALYGHEAYQGIESTVSERYDEAERVTGIPHTSLLVISSVCGRVARSRRRAELGFWLHAEVAKLDPDEQTAWLQRAVDESLSKSDLRALMRGKTLAPGDGSGGGGGGGSNGDWDGKDPADRVTEAARRVYHQGVVRNGEVHVPLEPWRQLAASLGEE